MFSSGLILFFIFDIMKTLSVFLLHLLVACSFSEQLRYDSMIVSGNRRLTALDTPTKSTFSINRIIISVWYIFHRLCFCSGLLF